MKIKQVTAKQFALETSKFLGHAQHAPLVVRSDHGPALVIRAVSDDELAYDLLTANPRFQASIRRNRAAGKKIPLRQVRESL